MTSHDAGYFDRWYADIDASPRRRALFRDALDLPDEVEPSSMVPLEGLEELAALLQVGSTDLLVDVGCGRGGPGMWLARRTGCRLLGVDFAPLAVAHAERRRSLFGLETRATFRVGTLEDPPLEPETADAVVCVDAVQFAASVPATLARLREALRPGGRIVLTSWEAVMRGDVDLSERLRTLDLASALVEAGFDAVEVLERPTWHEAALRMWRAALATPVDGDPAITSMHDEGERSVQQHDQLRRVLATGRRE